MSEQSAVNNVVDRIIKSAQALLTDEIHTESNRADNSLPDQCKVALKSLLSRMTKNAQEIVKSEENQCKNLHTDGIIKEWDESLHPRDEHGRFTSAFGGASIPDFANAVVEAKATLPPQKAWRVTAHPESELKEYYPDAQFHITKGGSTVAVASDGDIVSVCKKDGDTTKGRELLEMAVENGGTKLDSYDGNHGFYIKCGFEPVSWCKWEDEYTPPDWSQNLECKKENIIFYKYTGNTSQYSTPKEFYDSVPASVDYDAAKDVRDNTM